MPGDILNHESNMEMNLNMRCKLNTLFVYADRFEDVYIVVITCQIVAPFFGNDNIKLKR